MPPHETPEDVLIHGRRVALQDHRRSRIERQYSEVHTVDRDEYRRCIEASSAIMINNTAALCKLTDAERLTLGANIEAALVDLAHRHLTGRS